MEREWDVRWDVGCRSVLRTWIADANSEAQDQTSRVELHDFFFLLQCGDVELGFRWLKTPGQLPRPVLVRSILQGC